MPNRKLFIDLTRRGQNKRLCKESLKEQDENIVALLSSPSTSQSHAVTIDCPSDINSARETLRSSDDDLPLFKTDLQSQGPDVHELTEDLPYSVGDRTVLSQIQLTLADICANQKRIFHELALLRSELRHIPEERPEQSASLSDMFGNLPFTTHAGLEDFQNNLDDQLSKQFVKLLTSVGGKDLQQSIHHMLRRVMVDQLAMEFSFTGKTMGGVSKPAFSKTKVCKYILVAVQKMFGPQEATEAKLSTIVGKWLQQAKSRVGRRGKGKTPTIEEDSSANH